MLVTCLILYNASEQIFSRETDILHSQQQCIIDLPLPVIFLIFTLLLHHLGRLPYLKFKPKQLDGGTDIKILIWWILKKITLVINQGLSTGSFHHLNGPSNQTTNLPGEEGALRRWGFPSWSFGDSLHPTLPQTWFCFLKVIKSQYFWYRQAN